MDSTNETKPTIDISTKTTLNKSPVVQQTSGLTLTRLQVRDGDQLRITFIMKDGEDVDFRKIPIFWDEKTQKSFVAPVDNKELLTRCVEHYNTWYYRYFTPVGLVSLDPQNNNYPRLKEDGTAAVFLRLLVLNEWEYNNYVNLNAKDRLASHDLWIKGERNMTGYLDAVPYIFDGPAPEPAVRVGTEQHRKILEYIKPIFEDLKQVAALARINYLSDAEIEELLR